jgi:hypothetical protein
MIVEDQRVASILAKILCEYDVSFDLRIKPNSYEFVVWSTYEQKLKDLYKEAEHLANE